jgi:nucleotide-binding universal stress UspA family protein
MEAVKSTPRLALDNILFTTDFSPASERAFLFALAFARWYGSKITVAHAVTPEPHYSVPLDPLPVDMDPFWQNARNAMTAFETSHSFHGVKHASVLEQGSPWEVVSRVMRQQAVDLLVLGTHGRQGWKKLVLGSEAEVIFRQATCPVLTVGPHVAAMDPERWKPYTIVYATDFSPSSLQALPLALSIAEESQANLILLHLTPLVPIDAQERALRAIEERLQALVPAEATDWCKASVLVRFEFPAEGILRLARERAADLIVMGARKRGAPQAASHIPWATAAEVVSHAQCPVLTVRGS